MILRNREKPIQRTARGFVAYITILIFVWLSGCSAENENGLPKPPLKIPFEVQKSGTKIENEIQVVDYRTYIFSLDFMYKENDQIDRARVKKLVGDDMQDKDGDPGVPTRLHFKISQSDASGEKSIFDQELRELRLRSWGADSLDKHIAYVNLKPGHYLISIESLIDSPELIGTPIFFTMRFNPKVSKIE